MNYIKFNPFSLADTFKYIYSRGLLKTLMPKEKSLMMTNSSFCHNVFKSFQ